MKKIILLTTTILIVVMIPICILALKYNARLENFAGNFTRTFPYQLIKSKGMDLIYNSFYMIAKDSSKLYLYNSTTIPRLFIVDSLFKHVDTINIEVESAELKNKGCTKILLDGGDFYVCYGPEHMILQGKVQQWTAAVSKFSPPFFTDAVQISKDAFVFKYTSSNTKKLALRKVSASGIVIENDTIFKAQVDGQFCTSGHLKYNEKLNVLIYVYAYRNEILVMDTNLNLITTFKTIDDIDSVRFTVSKINSSGDKVITAPTILVNQRCATYGDYLFVHSKIRGKNEDDITFEYSTNIDVYNVIDGKYEYSIRLPNSKKTPVKQIEVFDGMIYAISDRFLNRYKYELPGMP